MTLRNAGRWLVLGLCLAAGCAGTPTDPMGRENSLEISQRNYTQLVRWGEIERASVFVEEDKRDAFLGLADAFDSLRVTDFETGTPNFDEGKSHCTVNVTYHVYSLRTLEEKKIRETQEWYRDPGLSNTWTVRPQIAAIVTAFQ